MSTTALAYNGDLAGQAESRLLQQYRLPVITALVRALAAGTQQLEDIAWSVLTSTLDVCSAHRLDQWGDLVGEARGGLTDAQYRGFIQARILANRSSGKLDEIIRVAQMITAPSTVVSRELAPKHLTIYIYRDSFLEPRMRGRCGRLLRAIHPAGTFLEIIEVQAGYFGFAADPDALGFNVGGLARIM